MNVVVTYKTEEDENIIYIDRKQKLIAGLRILQEAGKTSYTGEPMIFHSRSRRRVVSSDLTFEELDIYSGEVLSII